MRSLTINAAVLAVFALSANASDDFALRVGSVGRDAISTGGIFTLGGKVVHSAPTATTSGFYRVRGGFWSLVLTIQAHEAPPLYADQSDPSQVRLHWAKESRAFTLETTRTVGDPASWQPVATPPVEVDGEMISVLPRSGGTQFYRLRRSP